MNALLMALLCLLWASETTLADKDTFSQLSEAVFNDIHCIPFAYGDFNADKLVDIFCVSVRDKATVEIWLAQDKEPLFKRTTQIPIKK